MLVHLIALFLTVTTIRAVSLDLNQLTLGEIDFEKPDYVLDGDDILSYML